MSDIRVVAIRRGYYKERRARGDEFYVLEADVDRARWYVRVNEPAKKSLKDRLLSFFRSK